MDIVEFHVDIMGRSFLSRNTKVVMMNEENNKIVINTIRFTHIYLLFLQTSLSNVANVSIGLIVSN